MKKIKSIFTDKASLVLRKMLMNPEKKWIVNDFLSEGVSLGWTSEILTEMEKEGYIERVSKGPSSYSILKNSHKLIADWVRWYRFKYNTVFRFYSNKGNIEKRLIDYLKKKNISFALTLFSGARKVAPYVKDPSIHIYIPDLSLLGDLVKFRQTLGVLELKGTGNVSLVIPFYRNSVFKYLQSVRGIKVVSSLQLYLDLYTYSPRGREQAEYLHSFYKSKGVFSCLR